MASTIAQSNPKNIFHSNQNPEASNEVFDLGAVEGIKYFLKLFRNQAKGRDLKC